MKKEFIPYEQALALKELGFDEPCLEAYDKNGMLYYSITDKLVSALNFNLNTPCSAPLYQQAFKWFRKKHKLGHMINGIGFETFIMNIGGIIEVFPMFKTYEEAELACLNKLIELIKTK